MLWKCCTNLPANLENLAVAIGLKNVSFHLNPKERQCQECWIYYTIALISQAGKVVLKILQARLQQYVKHALPDVQAGFRKGRGTRDQIANIHWITEKARVFQKDIYFCFIDYAKAFFCMDHNKLENSKRDGDRGPPYLPPEKSVCRSRSTSWQIDGEAMETVTDFIIVGSKITADGDYSHEIKRCLFLRTKAMTNTAY